MIKANREDAKQSLEASESTSMLSRHSVKLLVSKLASSLRRNPAARAAPRSKPPPPHNLILYDYEASPWCRLVREYLTILDLTVHMRPCPRETLVGEGVFTERSRFRGEAMDRLIQQQRQQQNPNPTLQLMFPILVDKTLPNQPPVIIQQSYDILDHLWETYGKSVLHTPPGQLRQDQRVNASSIPFPLRFLSLVSPSYLRPWPSCGVFRIGPYRVTGKNGTRAEMVLYQSEGCPASRLVRELLCSLEIPYQSIPVAEGTFNSAHDIESGGQTLGTITPVLIDRTEVLRGHEECADYLWQLAEDSKNTVPTWFDVVAPDEDLGQRWNRGRSTPLLFAAAYTAFLKGRRDFVPPRAFD